MKRTFNIVFALLFVFLSAGVKSCCDETPIETAEIIILNNAQPAGVLTGYRFDADGTIYHWSGIAVGQSETKIGLLSENQQKNLWEAITKSGIMDPNTETQNGSLMASVFASIQVTKGDLSRRIRWKIGPNSPTSPEKALALYKYCQQLAHEIQNP